MDEAFSALDPLIRRDMQQELVELQNRLQKTIVFVSHDLDEAIALGGRIVLMKDGAIVQVGTAEEVLTNPATPYVARFVEHIDVASVLKVGALLASVPVLLRSHEEPGAAADRMEAAGWSSALVVDAAGHLEGRAELSALRQAQRAGHGLGRAVHPCGRVHASCRSWRRRPSRSPSWTMTGCSRARSTAPASSTPWRGAPRRHTR